MVANVIWTSYNPLENGAKNEDPLGFYAYALRLAEEWLPGITTRTRRVRYYSMICGGLQLIEEEFGNRISSAENQDAERLRLFLRWERLWVVWNVVLTEATSPGLVGRNKTEPLLRNGSFQTNSVDFPFIQRQPDLGALGSYKSSSEALGFLCVDKTQLTTAGHKLAGLFWQYDGNNTGWHP